MALDFARKYADTEDNIYLGEQVSIFSARGGQNVTGIAEMSGGGIARCLYQITGEFRG